MKFSFSILLITLTVIGTMCDPAPSGTAEIHSAVPELVWEQVIQSENYDYDLQKAALGKQDNAVTVVVGSRLKGKLSAPEGFLAWRVNETGAVNLKLDLAGLAKNDDAGLNRISVFGVVSFEQNNFGLFINEGNAPSLLILNQAGRPVRENKLGAGQKLYLTKVSPAQDGSLLILGQTNGNGWLAKIDRAGKLIWERNLGSEGVAVILDAAATANNDFTLLGSYRDATNPTSWIGKINANGEIILKSRMAGQAQSIASSPDGTSIVVGERAVTGGREIWAKGLNASLTESWTTTIISGLRAGFPFKAAALSSRGWVVVGSDQTNLPFLSQLSRDGQILSTYIHQYDQALVPIIGRFEVLAADQDIFFQYTLAAVNDKGEQRQSVRVLKLVVR